MENWWAIAGTLLGALIAGSAVLLNSVYSAKSTLKRENRNRLIEEKERDVKELETLYQDILHSLDKLTRRLGSLETNELEKYYKMEIRMELISTKEIVDKLKTVSNDISKMVSKLPKMPEEFIPKFEEDYERQSRLNTRKKAKEERKEKGVKSAHCWTLLNELLCNKHGILRCKVKRTFVSIKIMIKTMGRY